MSRKLRKYKEKGIRAEFSEVNKLGVREYETKIFNEHNTLKRNERSANDWLNKQAKIFAAKGTLDKEQMTFSAYAAELAENYLCEAEIKDGEKICGLKGWNKVGKYHLQMLMNTFAKARVQDITEKEITNYRIKRRRQVGVVAVNRELALLRKILHLAYSELIISRIPIFNISLADEKERDRILTPVEEIRLMQILEKEKFKRIKPIIISALETAIRKSELEKLKWSEIDLDSGIIRLLATNTKTATERIIPMSLSVKEELEKLADEKIGGLVFDFTNFRGLFKELLKLSEIESFRFHDFRHHATTNFVRSKVEKLHAMKITGHTTEKTFRRYANLQAEDLKNEFQKFDDYKIAREMPELVSEAAN